MIPVWSGPRLDLVLGQDHSVRDLAADLAALELSPPGRTAPGSATATVAPGPKFQAPQTIWRGSPSPTSTAAELEPVGIRMLLGLEHAADPEPLQVAVRVRDADPARFLRPRPSRRRASRSSSSSGTSIGTYSRSQLSGTRIRTASARGGRRPRAAGCPGCRGAAAPPARGRSRTRTGPALGVDADVLEHLRIDDAGAAHLEPAGVLAGPAARAAADPARDVGLDRRLREREEVRPEADAPFRPVERAHHVQQRPLQVGQGDAPRRRRGPRTGGRSDSASP